MIEDQNIILARRIVEEGFGDGQPGVFDELADDDFIEHQSGMKTSKEGPQAAINALHHAFPDITYSLINVLADKDLVTTHYRAKGTHKGNLGPMPATGKTFEIDVIDIMRFKDGKLHEHWGVPDRLAMIESLGFWPPKFEVRPLEGTSHRASF